jgi:hypothetical protein
VVIVYSPVLCGACSTFIVSRERERRLLRNVAGSMIERRALERTIRMHQSAVDDAMLF